MKVALSAITALAVVGASGQHALAGDREWATAGKILTGVFAASVLSRAFEPVPVYHHATVTYVPAPVVVHAPPPPPPVVVVPPPPVVYHQPVYSPPVYVVQHVVPVAPPRVVVNVVPGHVWPVYRVCR